MNKFTLAGFLDVRYPGRLVVCSLISAVCGIASASNASPLSTATGAKKDLPAGFLYVANPTNNGISAYEICKDGKLAPLVPPIIDCAGEPSQLSVSPDGRYLYPIGFSDNISQFRIRSDGALSSLTPPTLDVDLGIGRRLEFANHGHNVYLSSAQSGTLSCFRIGRDGGLYSLGPDTVQTIPGAMEPTVSVDGRYLYVPSFDAKDIRQFTIEDDGALKPMQPSAISCASNPRSLTLDPRGRFCYVTETQTGMVETFRIGVNGHLSAAKDCPLVPLDAGVQTIDPTGKFAYSTDAKGVREFTISANGRLIAMEPSRVPGFGYGALLVHETASGTFLYSGGRGVSAYLVQSSGVLKPINQFSNSTLENGPVYICPSPDWRSLYAVCRRSKRIAQFAILPNGALSSLNPEFVDTGDDASAVVAVPLSVSSTEQIQYDTLPY